MSSSAASNAAKRGSCGACEKAMVQKLNLRAGRNFEKVNMQEKNQKSAMII